MFIIIAVLYRPKIAPKSPKTANTSLLLGVGVTSNIALHDPWLQTR